MDSRIGKIKTDYYSGFNSSTFRRIIEEVGVRSQESGVRILKKEKLGYVFAGAKFRLIFISSSRVLQKSINYCTTVSWKFSLSISAVGMLQEMY